MPLFGHKNKNTGAHSGNGQGTDPVAQDFSGPNTTTTTGTQTGSDGRGNLDNTQGRNWDNNAGYNASEVAGGAQNQRNTAGTNTSPNVGAGSGTHHGIGHGHHAGAPVGSAALREQAMLRDREAQNFQAQSAELVEAERLEQKAREHRERAVAQGAHPMNKFLGGGEQTGTGQNVDQSRGTNF